jgi:hypothetical protein
MERERGDWMVFLCLEDKGDEKQRATRRERKSTETYQARKRDCRWMACKDENMIKLQDSQDCDYWWGCPSIQYIQYVFACGPTQLRTNANLRATLSRSNVSTQSSQLCYCHVYKNWRCGGRQWETLRWHWSFEANRISHSKDSISFIKARVEHSSFWIKQYSGISKAPKWRLRKTWIGSAKRQKNNEHAKGPALLFTRQERYQSYKSLFAFLLVLFYTNTSFPCNLVVEDTPETSGWLVRHENTNPPRLTTHPELAHPDIQSLAPVSSWCSTCSLEYS